MSRSSIVGTIVFCALIALGIAGRVLPHPPNFTPVAAAALFAGFFFSRRTLAILVPLAIMLATDLLWLGTYDARLMAAVYLCMLFPIALRPFLRGKASPLRVGVSSIVMSCVFFIVTNWAVWACSGMYASTWDGLVQCYLAAIPFFRHTLTGDLIWSAGIFGAYFAATRLNRSLATSRQRARLAEAA